MIASETNKHWKKGYISGSFDMFHIGHLNLIRQAKERCDYLIVGVLEDEIIADAKKRWPTMPLKDRIDIVGALKYVDDTDVTTRALIDKIVAWGKYRFDAMFSGDDHISDGWAHEEEDLKALGADLVFFPYTKEISTTLLREKILMPKSNKADKTREIGAFTHIFPFDKINKGERIIIYGMGNLGGQYARQLTALDFCCEVTFTDSYAKIQGKFEGFECVPPEQLLKSPEIYDRVVVASVSHYDRIIEKLRALGISPDRIV